MRLDFDGFRENMVEDFESIITQLNNSKIVDDYTIKVDAEKLESQLNDLRNDIVLLCGITDPETGKSLLDKQGFKIGNWNFNDMLDEQGF